MSIPELIGELVQKYGSVNRASRKADIPVTTLFRLYNGERQDISFRTLRKVAAALDKPLDELVRRLEDGRDGGNSH